MKITITPKTYTAIPEVNCLVGYSGEHNAREIIVDQPQLSRADTYRLRFMYSDGTSYDLLLNDGKAVITGSLLKETGSVKCQWIASRQKASSYELVAKSNIFRLRIEKSLGDDVTPIPTYEQTRSVLDTILDREDEAAKQAQIAAEKAAEISASAELISQNASDIAELQNGTGIKDKVITAPQTDFIIATTNLFNEADLQTGGYYYYTGEWRSSEGMCSSNYIPVVPGRKYKIGQHKTAINNNVVFFDKNHRYVTGLSAADTSSAAYVTVPDNKEIAYMCFPVSNDKIKNRMCVEGTNYPDSYIPYGLTVYEMQNTFSGGGIKFYDDTVVYLLGRINELKSKGLNQWSGKKWYAYGTSCSGADCAEKLAELSGLELTKSEAGGIIPSLHANEDCAYTACMNTSDGKTNADLITLEVITDDFSSDETISSARLGEVTDTTESTFCGSLNKIISALQHNTAAQIVIIIGIRPRYEKTDSTVRFTPQSEKVSLCRKWEQYTEEVCARNGVKCINAAAEGGFGYNRVIDSGNVADDVHPTPEGSKRLARFYWSKLQNIPCWKE